MNANELADELDYCYRKEYPCPVSKEASTMLRQQQERIKQLEETQEYLYKTHDADKAQIEALKRPNNVVGVPADKLAEMQAEIEALKQIIDANNLNQNIGQFVKPTNEPVAWIRDGDDQLSLVRQKDDGYMVWKPLYTHPVKELTDAEIWSISAKYGDLSWKDFTLDFARAILRKAQER